MQCAFFVLEEKENSVLVMACGRLGLMLPRGRHTSHQIQTYVSYFHQILIAWRKGDFSSRFTSLESCGREEKLGKLTENISTITVTTFAMVSLSTTSVDDMLEKFQGIKQLYCYCYCYCYCNNCRHLQTKKNENIFPLPCVRGWITCSLFVAVCNASFSFER